MMIVLMMVNRMSSNNDEKRDKMESIFVSNLLSIKDMKKTKNTLNDEYNVKDNVIENEEFNGDLKEKVKEKLNVNEDGCGGIFSPFRVPLVSLFENVFSKEPVREVRLDKFLFASKFKERVEAYRASGDDEFRKKIKKGLPCVTPSGTFRQRRESGMIKHTGLLCIDIDSKDNPRIDLEKSKQIIGEYFPSLYYAGLSLGGEGIFLLFRILNPEMHKPHFEALALFLNKQFRLQVDRSVKSPVSLRVASYDENPYYNPNPVPFSHVMGMGCQSGHVVKTVDDMNKVRERVKKAVSIIQKEQIDITNRYENWFKVGSALAHEFGEEGRFWFHMVSRVYENYDEGECDIQYNRCLKYQVEGKITIASFFFLCKNFGIEYMEEW